MTEPESEQKTYIVTTSQTTYEEYPIQAANAEHARSIWQSMRHAKPPRGLLSTSYSPGDDETIIEIKEYE